MFLTCKMKKFLITAVIEIFLFTQFSSSVFLPENYSNLRNEFNDYLLYTTRRIRGSQPLQINIQDVVTKYKSRLPTGASYMTRLDTLKNVLGELGIRDLSIFYKFPSTWEEICLKTILEGEQDLQERLMLYRLVREATSFTDIQKSVAGKYYAEETIKDLIDRGKINFSQLNVNEREQLKGAFYYDLVEEAPEKVQMFAEVFLPENIIPSKPESFFGNIADWLGERKLALYNLAYKGIAGFMAYLWFAGRDIFSNPSPIGIATSIGETLLLYYMYKGIADLYGTAFLSMTTSPKIYSENANIIRNGIQKEQKTAIWYGVYATEITAVDEAIDKMEKSFLANGGKNNENLVMVYGSDTRPTDTGVDIILHELELIKRLQEKYPGQVFYYHRHDNYAKKWGNYQDFIQYVISGENKAVAYTGDNWPETVRRKPNSDNPENKLFQLTITRNKLLQKYKDNPAMLQKIESLLPEEVAKSGMVGDFSKISGTNKIKYIAVTDNDNLWPERSLVKVIAKMVNNPDIIIAQPAIRVQNVGESRYTAWSASLPQSLMNFIPKANAWLGTEQFMGKGVIEIERYYNVMMRKGNEILDPKTRCHDFRESLYLKTAYMSDVEILENSPVNFFQELKRQYGWRPGDLQGLYYEGLPRFAPYVFFKKLLGDPNFKPLDPLPRSQARILEFIGNTVIMPVAFVTFLITNYLQALVPGILKTGDPILDLITAITALAGVTLIPSIIGPIAQKIRLGEYRGVSIPIQLGSDIIKGVANVVNSTLVLMQGLYDAPLAVWAARQQIIAAQQGGQAPAWNPMAAIKTNLEKGVLGVIKVYSERKIATAIAAGMLISSIMVGYIYPQTSALDWAKTIWPIASSFLLGPFWAWFTGQSETILRDASLNIEGDVNHPQYKEVGDALYEAAGKDLEKKFLLIQEIYNDRGGRDFVEDLTKVAIYKGGDVWEPFYNSDLANKLWNSLSEPLRSSIIRYFRGDEIKAKTKLYDYFVGLSIKVNALKNNINLEIKRYASLASAEFKAAMDFDMDKYGDDGYFKKYAEELFKEFRIDEIGMKLDDFIIHIKGFLGREKEIEEGIYR